MLNDPLSNVMSHIQNCEQKGRTECFVKPNSTLVKSVLKILKDNDFIGDFKVVEETKGGLIEIKLIGNINKCGVIKPRYAVKRDNFEKFEKRYLPAANFGFLIVSTPLGILMHKDAIAKNQGGKLLAYCY